MECEIFHLLVLEIVRKTAIRVNCQDNQNMSTLHTEKIYQNISLHVIAGEPTIFLRTLDESYFSSPVQLLYITLRFRLDKNSHLIYIKYLKKTHRHP